MSIEKIKAIAKEKYGKDLTDAQAVAYIEKYGSKGKLADDELNNISGGYNTCDKEYREGKYCDSCGVWCDQHTGPHDGAHTSMICPICGTIYD